MNKYEIEELRRKELMESNSTRLKYLHAKGIAIDPQAMLKIRTDYLTDHLVGPIEELRRLGFEVEWEHMIGEILDGIESQVRQAELLEGTPAEGHQPLTLPGDNP